MSTDRGALMSSKQERLCWIASAILLTVGQLSSMTAQQSAATPDQNALPEITTALRAQHFSEALKRSRDALIHAPRDPRLWTLEALSYQGLHQPVEAMSAFRKALVMEPNYLAALQGAAQLSYANHSPQTEELLERLLGLRPEDQVAHAMLGELSFKKGDCPAAVSNFSKSSETIAQRPEVLMQYSSCLVQMSRFEESIPVFEQLHTLLPNDDSVVYDLALAEFRAGHVADAKATLEPALDTVASAEDDLTLGAEIAESQGNTQQALDLLHKAIQLHPQQESAYLDFVNLAYQHASMSVGLDVVNLGLRQMPNAAELHFARGVLLCQLGKVDEGFGEFNRANELDPKLSFVGVAEGIAQSQTHHSAAALQKFRVEVKQHPDDALAWYLLAEGLSEQGYAKGSPEFDETLKAAMRAAQLNPKRTDAENLLASIYLQAGETQAAIKASEVALAINPEDPQALYHLVLAVRKTDQKSELPELVKRLMKARSEAEAKTERSRPHTLVEASPANPGNEK
jgi:tetratricopeptide (TPR) repeat protein